jgi:hypothetical protein
MGVGVTSGARRSVQRGGDRCESGESAVRIEGRVENNRNAAGVGIAARAELPRRGGWTRFGPIPAEHARMAATK